MSFSDVYDFVADNEDLELYQFFGSSEATETTVVAPTPTGDLFILPPLHSPFAGPPEDVQGQTGGWLSSSAPDPAGGLDAVNFEDFLGFDESTADLPAPVEEAAAGPPPPELGDSSISQDEPVGASETTEDVPIASQLDAVRDEIAQLKAALAVGNPRKQKLGAREVSSPKRQKTSKIGPIETLWSPLVTEDEQRAAHSNLVSPATPKPSSPQHHFTAPPSTPTTNTSHEDATPPKDLQSLQKFLNDDPAFIHGASHPVYVSTTPSDNTMGHLVHTRLKRAPPKQALKRAPKSTTNEPNKIIKKLKTTPKKNMQYQRNTSTASHITSSPASSSPHRSIDELLAANFYSLNAQEKLRLMLPMLRKLDPRELESKLAVLPCIQAKGTGHEVTVASAIHKSPDSREVDDILATKLTFGITSSSTPAARCTSSSSPAPAAPDIQNSLLSHKGAHLEVSGDYGATRQLQALGKAAALQAQGKQR